MLRDMVPLRSLITEERTKVFILRGGATIAIKMQIGRKQQGGLRAVEREKIKSKTVNLHKLVLNEIRHDFDINGSTKKLRIGLFDHSLKYCNNIQRSQGLE